MAAPGQAPDMSQNYGGSYSFGVQGSAQVTSVVVLLLLGAVFFAHYMVR